MTGFARLDTSLGSGLLEVTYSTCLYYELQKSGLKVEKEKALPIIYDGVELYCAYHLDLFVEDKLIVELKSIESFKDLAQTLTYLKASREKS